MGGRIAKRAASKLIAAARKAGLDTSRLAHTAAPDTPDTADTAGPDGAYMPLSRFYDLWEEVMRRVDDPGLPLRVATAFDVADYELLGFLCLTSRTLGDALQAMRRYYTLWEDGPRWEVEHADATFILRYDVPGPQRLGVACAIECGFAQLVHATRRITHRAPSPLEVRFPHRGPGDPREHQRFFGAPVCFRSPHAALVFPASILDTPLVKAEPRLSAYLQQQAEHMVARLPRPSSITEQTKAFLREALPQGEVSLEAAAAHIGLPVRALRGRLARARTTFRTLVAETRLELARRYLEDARLSIEEIASILGFSEPSAFYRAFKRWTGLTPRQFRQQRA